MTEVPLVFTVMPEAVLTNMDNVPVASVILYVIPVELEEDWVMEVTLLIFTSDRGLMGELVNPPTVKRVGWLIVILVVALNGWLLVGTALGV